MVPEWALMALPECGDDRKHSAGKITNQADPPAMFYVHFIKYLK